ncbi:CBS domain-containing protein [Pseudemcibacter aquimaris]|uniref:CBS domain-containing protein n=1 Tax=Pseudemcibacter aquimaris TaxID=2857064 RepID=UPI002012A832|nr:CBS domain-containing protein [Pseudemcibacter aquimaris]MCC3861787.1 CBS domain-containing protein [Pseudemcibacter aquimaris]WDU58542.1 CBS domain-containing protein [Pseudemcibacter aquimaris]
MTEIKHETVKEVMTTNLIMVDGLTTISDALDIMRKNEISSLVINRRNESDEYGLLTASDIANEVLVPDLAPERTSAYQVMQKPVLCMRANMNIRYAIRLCAKFKVSRALVIENDEAVGIVTLRDMVLRYTEEK